MSFLRAGTILRVNLSSGEVTREPTERYAERFIGSKAINMKMLLDGVGPGTHPLDPGNMLLFGAGPLVGTPFPGACRLDVMAASPISGGLGGSSMGGYFAGELKFAGYDHLVVEGKAAKPVYLSIRDDRIRVCDAAAVWGRDTHETPALIRGELNEPNAQVVCIGPAGERKVVFASIVTVNGSVAARSGLGAVMGSKNLKAVAVRGTNGMRMAHPKAFLNECREVRQRIQDHPVYGVIRHHYNRQHDHEWRMFANLRGGWKPGTNAVSEEEFSSRHLLKRFGCMACPVACLDGYDIADVGSGTVKCSPYGDFTWGVQNSDHMVMLKAQFDCQRYGLDARSVSGILAWLMELYQEGTISAKDTDGVPMGYGSRDAILALPRKLSYREGIGELLADGLPAAARRIGKGAEDYLRLTKGSPIDVNLPATKGRGLACALSATGEASQSQAYVLDILAGTYQEDRACFERSLKKHKDRAETELNIRDAPDPRTVVGKAALVRHAEHQAAICDIAGVCSWLTPFIGLPVDPGMIAQAITTGSGTGVTMEALSEAATRLRHMERVFGALRGLNRNHDSVSKGFYRQLNSGVSELGLTEADLERMKDDYYQLMGWDVATGIPTQHTLIAHGLDDVADRLESVQ